ncbi:biotin/lipoyl-binding protein [Microcoleus sp. FACHB-68]|nr:biotin/lipoyl-binding protein [Microcoleus sp. FACHB-68]
MEQEYRPKDKPLLKPAGWRLIAIISAAAVALSVAGFYHLSQVKAEKIKAEEAQTVPAPPKAVTALGRLEPQGEVIKLSAPASIEGTRIKEILVKQGDKVRAGDAIAVLDSRERLAAVLAQAEKQVKVAEARLAQVEAGAKAGEIEAQKATIARLEAQLRGEKETQEATIARLEAQLRGEKATQEATITRLNAQREGDNTVQEATLGRLTAQLKGEIAAQQAKIDRIKAQLSNAESEYSRHQQLYRDGAIAISLLDNKRLTFETVREELIEEQANLNKIEGIGREQLVEQQANINKIDITTQQQINEATATRSKTVETLEEQLNEARSTRDQTISTLQQQINEAKANLERISEVRPVDVRTAQAEVESAVATVAKAQADLDQAFIKTPTNGQILKVHTRPGETVGNEGIADVGQTELMFVVAEIYESDIEQVKVGQPATITSSAINGELRGTVDEIGLQIGKKDVLDTDPAADVDARVVEVKIRLNPEDSKRVAGLTNLQVEVKIYI